ncbi:MAG TPA: asparagine synthase (glutamine-hydrolyzing) [Acetobacteraceae bacterium]|nr:asparagine synthase (glutamine-hydrolyzing) [Acetobacteraceae bacterium]
MCGLAGLFRLAGKGRGNLDTDAGADLRRMTDAMTHRGPDGDGFLVEPGVALGHRRLVIIDPEGGHQPMFNEDGSVAIVFNGCIYNHLDLRPELEALGHRFASRCDTEVIVHAWEAWGPACLERLAGMFAFAIWDRNRNCLFLARDRLGKKPLHYATLPDGRFAFASELSGLTALPTLPRRIDPAAVDDFFAYGFVPEPATIWRDIRKLPAAHSMLIGPDRIVPAPACYWRIPLAEQAMAEAEAVRALDAHLVRAVRARLIADVPLGAFLSGGVDSSAVVAVAAGLKAQPLDTFTIGFFGADERPLSEQVATRYHTAHHSEAATVDYIAAARAQAAVYGEPFGDHSSVPTLRVCELARRDATVALSGDGGDEIFAGYRRHRWHRIAETARRTLPAAARKRLLAPLARAYPKLDRAPRWLRAKHTLTEISLDAAAGYYRTLCKLHHDQRRALFSPALRAALDGHDPAEQVAALMAEAETETDDPVRQAQFVDLRHYLPGDILTKVDRAGMAHSLEVRAPLLDHTLVEWAVSLPTALKLRGASGKHIFKQALAPRVPGALLHRPKQGFAAALAAPLRAGSPRLRERLLGPAMQESGLFDADAVAAMIEAHASGGSDHSQALWQLLVFEGFLAREAALPGAAPRVPETALS